MQPGMRRHPLRIQIRGESRDALGQPSIEWNDGPIIWTRLITSKGSDSEQVDRKEGQTALVFHALSRSKAKDLNPDDRLKWKRRQVIVKSISPIGDGEEYVEIVATYKSERTS